MADNFQLNNNTSSGITLAADDISNVWWQKVKIAYGGDDSATQVSDANPLPIDDAGGTLTVDALNDGSLTVRIGDATNVASVSAGGALQVDVASAIPTGANTIGSVNIVANDGVDIGDVDVASLPATVHSADYDTGAGTDTTLTFGIAVPASGGAAVVPGDATAGLKVDLGADNDVTVTGTVTETNSAAILADTAAMDTNLATLAGAVSGAEMQVDIVADGAGLATAANQPAVYTDDTSTHATGTSEGNLLMAAATPTDGSVDANDIGAVAMSTDRRLHVDAQIVGQDADVTIADGGNVITVDGTITASNAAGDVAHDTADSGNPIKIGAKSLNFGSNPTEVGSADRTDLYATNAGQLFVLGGHPNSITTRANYTAAQTNTAIASTSEKIVVTRCSVTADNANSVDVQARIGFGATTTPTAGGVLLSHPGIAAGSGVVEGNGSGILGVGAAGEDVRITSEVPTGGSIDVVLTYFEISA